MELLPTFSNNKNSSQQQQQQQQQTRFKRSSSMPLILTRLVRFTQMDFEVKQ